MRFLVQLQRGWTIGIAALKVALREPKLMALATLPLLTVVALIYLAIFGPLKSVWIMLVHADKLVVYAIGLLGYLLLWFIMMFFNTALIAATLDYFENGKVSVRSAFAMAVQRLPQILAWSVFAATVGLLLSFISSMIRGALESVSTLLGDVLGGLLEASWVVATYFVAPVLIIEGVGPVAAVKRSMQVLRQAWGESLGSGVGLGLFWLVLVALPVTAMFGLLAMGALPQEAWWFGAGFALIYTVAAITLLAVVAALQCSALFVFAATGKAPSGFDGAAMAGAFQPRR